MDRPAENQLTAAGSRLRDDARRIAGAGIAAVSPPQLHRRVAAVVADHASSAPAVHVLAVGKAAAGMFAAFAADPPRPIAGSLVVAPVAPDTWPWPAEIVIGGHPYANAGSELAGTRALALAAQVPADGCLVCLLSGGASALMAAPIAGLTLAAKQQAVTAVMKGGADITALNAVRKHLSRVKGGRLAAACAGATVTAALSDVIGDDLSVIGSGPGVGDWSTWDDAAAAIARFVGQDGLAPEVRRVIDDGLRGLIPDTPKPGAPALARTAADVVGGRREAMDGARRAAEALGYAVVVLSEPVTGEARDAALAWWEDAMPRVRGATGPIAIVSSGETTVRVRGQGRGGRNQEFALALLDRLAAAGRPLALASLGSDGIDGPTDAAGALVDATSAARARQSGLDAARALAENDSAPFLDALGDLVRTGPTGTNVGDLQVLLAGPA